MCFRIFRAMVRLALSLFFRQVEVEARHNLPSVGPVLLVPNHTNALVDPLVLMTAMRRPLTVTAKNVLARNPFLRGLMALFGVVTFHRREDVNKGADRRQNVRSLERCREILADGGAICIFPEGISHSDPKLRPFHVGPARIALDFLRKDGNPGRLRIVPVGLLYTEKDRFRSAVWLRFGTPIDVAAWRARHPEAGAAELTEEIRRRVAELTLNYESRRESALLTWAAQVVATGGRMPAPLGTVDAPVADRFRLLGRLQAGYRLLVEREPKKVDELSQRIRRYRVELRRAGVEPEEVYLPLHPGRALFFLIREMELVVVGATLALFGLVNHFLPYWIVRSIARKLSKEKDQWASNVIYPSLAIFPLFYAIQLTAAWLLAPPVWAGIYTVLLPYTGYYAILYGDRLLKARRRTATFLRFLFHREEQQRLASEGRAIIEEIRRLGDQLADERLDGDGVQEKDREPAFVLRASDLETQLRDDATTLREVVAGLDRLETVWCESRRGIQAQARGYFTPEEDDRVRQMLLAYRNYRLVLYEMIDRYLGYAEFDSPGDRLRALMIAYAASLVLYGKSMQLIQAYEHQPLVRAKLNEPDAKFGLGAGFFEEILRAYTSLDNYRHLASAGRFWLRERRAARRWGADVPGEWQSIAEVIRRYRSATRKTFWYLLVHRLHYDRRTLWRSLRRPVHRARYSLRALVGGRLATVHTTPNYTPSIGIDVLDRLRSTLQPGDVLQIRAERKITTALLPGFWKHSALYVGGRGDLERLGLAEESCIEKHWPLLSEGGAQFGYVIEAVSAGVMLSPLERCLQADDVLVLRPNVDDAHRRTAVAEAFSHLGKPYDFEFDFNVTTRLVCTELVYRSYHGKGTIEFPLTKRLGRFTLTCDDITRYALGAIEAAGSCTAAPFAAGPLVLRAADGKAHLIASNAVLGLLSAIQGGTRPSAIVTPQLLTGT